MKSVGFAALAGLALCAASASADLIGDAIRLDANGDMGSGSWALPVSALHYNPDSGLWTWRTSDTVEIRNDAGEMIAALSNVNLSFQDDPVITLNFVVTAGAATTHFIIASAVLGFSTGLYTAQASASITTTDGDGNGATSTGQFGVNDTFGAFCNGQLIGTSTQGVAVGGFGSQGNSGSIGPANYTASSMQSMWDFTLTPHDSASGTSVYVKTLVPTPGTLGLIGLAGLAAARRRR